MRHLPFVLLFSALVTPAVATDCSGDFFGAKPPIATGALTVDQTLCYAEFAVGYSDKTRTPLWSAEDLTKAQLSKHVPRHDQFDPETALPVTARAQIKDYTRS